MKLMCMEIEVIFMYTDLNFNPNCSFSSGGHNRV